MFCVNSITSYKFNGIPLTDNNIPKKIVDYNNFVSGNLSENNLDKVNLNIITINGLYGYRTGIVGWISNFCSLYLSKKNNPTRFQRFLNYMFNKDDKKILGNDFEIISYYLSLFNRCIPIINYGNWDPKNFLCTNDSGIINLSMPQIYNFNSLYGTGLFELLLQESRFHNNTKKPIATKTIINIIREYYEEYRGIIDCLEKLHSMYEKSKRNVRLEL